MFPGGSLTFSEITAKVSVNVFGGIPLSVTEILTETLFTPGGAS